MIEERNISVKEPLLITLVGLLIIAVGLMIYDSQTRIYGMGIITVGLAMFGSRLYTRMKVKGRRDI